MKNTHPLFNDPAYQKFLDWQKNDHTGVYVKLALVDVSGDLVVGILLAQILYWFAPGRNGLPRIKKFKEGRYWLAKRRSDWFKECRISPKQYDRAISRLQEKQIIVTHLMKFDGVPTPHLSVNWGTLVGLIEDQNNKLDVSESEQSTGTNCENLDAPNVKVDDDQRVKSLTVSTAKNNSKDDNNTSSSFFSERDIKEKEESIARELLAKWKERYPDYQCTQEETAALHQIVRFGINAFARSAFVPLCLKRSGRLSAPTFQNLLHKHGAVFQERAKIVQSLEFNPDILLPDGWSLVGLLASWSYLFKGFYNRQYHFSIKDIEAACDFIERDSKAKVENVAWTARLAWEKAETEKTEGFDKWFYSRKAGTLSSFLKHYESIEAELG